MNRLLKWLLCLCILITLPSLTEAQSARDSLWVVETVDDNEYVGQITYRDNDILRIKTTNIGEITIQMRDVKNIERVKMSQMVNGEFWFENPHATRYFFSPNGYGLRKGEGYYQNTWILFNQVSYGFTNNFTMGFGLFPTFLYGGEGLDGTILWITPKVSVPVEPDKVNVGFGALIGTAVGVDGAGGLAYGSVTLGSRDKNFTAGLGYGFANGDWADTPVINLSGMIRTGKRGFFMTENYLVSEGGEVAGFLSAGGRYVFKRLAIDYGGFVPVGVGGFGILPWLGINVPFGNKKLGD